MSAILLAEKIRFEGESAPEISAEGLRIYAQIRKVRAASLLAFEARLADFSDLQAVYDFDASCTLYEGVLTHLKKTFSPK